MERHKPFTSWSLSQHILHTHTGTSTVYSVWNLTTALFENYNENMNISSFLWRKFTETACTIAHCSSDLLKMVDFGIPKPRVLLGTIVTEYTSPEETFCSANVVAFTISFTMTAPSAELAVIWYPVASGRQSLTWQGREITWLENGNNTISAFHLTIHVHV